LLGQGPPLPVSTGSACGFAAAAGPSGRDLAEDVPP
jgi:hypothetical protein